jgi:hypothetical protein
MRQLSLLAALALAAALAGCRQTVMLGNGPGDDGSVGSDGGEDTAFPCGTQTTMLDIVPRSPAIILALDRSTSMQQTPFEGTTRLLAAEQALSTVVATYDDTVAFGYQEFPGFARSCSASAACCAGDVMPYPATGNANIIVRDMSFCDMNPTACPTSPEKPVADALARAQQLYDSIGSSAQDKYLVLITDGEPTCSMTACPDVHSRIAALGAFPDNVKTAIVGVDVANSACLDDLAMTGNDSRPGSGSPYYYPAPTEFDLAHWLDVIVRNAAQAACTITVRQQPADPSRVCLSIDGMLVPRDDTNGWEFVGNTTFKILVSGSWCDKLVTSHSIELNGFSGSPPTR